jgi:hypothetical protein
MHAPTSALRQYLRLLAEQTSMEGVGLDTSDLLEN